MHNGLIARDNRGQRLPTQVKNRCTEQFRRPMAMDLTHRVKPFANADYLSCLVTLLTKTAADLMITQMLHSYPSIE
mgnify:CR=1